MDEEKLKRPIDEEFPFMATDRKNQSSVEAIHLTDIQSQAVSPKHVYI